MKIIFVCFALISLVLIGCSKTNEETQLRNSQGNTGGVTESCDTVDMKYAANIQPILQANCYSCHSNGHFEHGVSLETYDYVKTQVNNGNLIGVITHASGYPAMPFGLPKLSDCTINKVKDWVGRGANNN
jgi:hypothetical protein